MRSQSLSQTMALVIATSFLIASVSLGQQKPRPVLPQQPLRTEVPAQKSGNTKTETVTSPSGKWEVGDSSTITESIVAEKDTPLLSSDGAEPTMRIALATDVSAATVSTNGHLMKAADLAQTSVPLNVARVRVESHLLGPLPAASNEYFGLRIAGLNSRTEAEEQAKLIRDGTSEQSQVVLDDATQTWGLLVGSRRTEEEAEATQARLEAAGFEAAVIDFRNSGTAERLSPSSAANRSGPSPLRSNASLITANAAGQKPASTPSSVATSRSIGPPTTAKPPVTNSVRLASRPSLPTRELVASAVGVGRLFSTSAPVVFGSDDEAKFPVRFNEKPYRGRIEVFANSRGLLTVVNVIGLEDYVRGVVANELSPGGYPAIEALKAQAIAARTYALKNRGQFMSQGYDLLPTTRSQVYRGLSSEQPLSTRAVDETRGMVATYLGQPINALYTSTCGGRTEDAGNIFNQAVPYLRARECSVEGKAAFLPFTIKSSREPVALQEEQHLPLVRAAAMLSVHNFGSLVSRISDSWLSSPASTAEVRTWLSSAAVLARQSLPLLPDDVNRPPAFATALSAAAFGASRGDTLLNDADVEYLLPLRDAQEVPTASRPDVALLVRDGYLSVFPDMTLRPRETMSRARVLYAISRLLESRGFLQAQKGTARPAADGTLVLRSAKGKDQPIRVSPDVYLFRLLGDSAYSVRSVALVGGEPVTFHVNAGGLVDYLEVRPAPNGASADRFSPFTNWTSELSLNAVRARLSRAAQSIGSIVNLRVAARGLSRRVTDLEVVGTDGIAHVRGGRIRSALGLREQLFVIDRKYDADGRVTGFVFTGRGWGHGVGMCQVGAFGLARQGWKYEQILKAYYTGIELTKVY
jgi:stage II sporulation protein D